MEISTIGLAKRSAESFFGELERAGVARLFDVRLHNTSQLSGFAKSADLAFFLRGLVKVDYVHELQLAPTAALLLAYRKKEISWNQYADAFVELLQERRLDELRPLFDAPAVLLCSEGSAQQCHRRLVAEYLAARWAGVTVRHL